MSADWTNILTSGIRRSAGSSAHLNPAFAAASGKPDPRLAWWDIVSSHSSATVPDFHGIPRTDLHLI
jgi:hypothetical protein